LQISREEESLESFGDATRKPDKAKTFNLQKMNICHIAYKNSILKYGKKAFHSRLRLTSSLILSNQIKELK
jgi:hypothetical protein